MDEKRRRDSLRNFICKCGKSYLSYAALHNHIKLKHSNNEIENFRQSAPQLKTNHQTNFEFYEIISKTQVDSKYLDQMVAYLHKISGGQREDEVELEVILKQIVAEASFVFEDYSKQPQNKIDKVFSHLISELYKHRIQADLLLQVAVFFIVYRAYLNQINGDSLYCSNTNSDDVLEVVNDVLMKQIYNKLSKYHFNTLALLHMQKKRRLQNFMYLVSKWLFNMRYTNSLLRRHRCHPN